MSTASLLYLYIVIGNLGWLVFVFCILSIIFLICTVVTGLESSFGEEKRVDGELSLDSKLFFRVFRITKPIVIVTLIIIILSSFYPSKQDIAFIVGGAALVSVAQSEEAQKLPENVLKAANAFLSKISEEDKETDNK